MQGWQIENQWHHPIVMRKNDERPMMSNKLKELEILEAKVKKKSTIESKLISSLRFGWVLKTVARPC
jgi:hypothetical protein